MNKHKMKKKEILNLLTDLKKFFDDTNRPLINDGTVQSLVNEGRALNTKVDNLMSHVLTQKSKKCKHDYTDLFDQPSSSNIFLYCKKCTKIKTLNIFDEKYIN